MKNIKISVIMPIRDTGIYLEESLESLSNQTFGDYELICVNDASEDEKTVEILWEHTKANGRISIIDLEMQAGAGEARNTGLRQAKGEYIIFLDGDDIFDRELLEILYWSASKSDADICICGYESFYVDENGKHSLGVHMPKVWSGFTDKVFSVDELKADALTYWPPSPCKLFRREFLTKSNISFQNLPSSNDVFFSCTASLLAEKIYYAECDKPLFFYRRNTGIQISSRRSPENLLKAVISLSEVMKERNMYEKQQEKIIYFLLDHSIYELQNCKDDSKKEMYYESVKEYLNQNICEIKPVDIFFDYCLESWLTKTYNDRWFEVMDDFYTQLKLRVEELTDALKIYHSIVLWGIGKRGTAFQKFSAEYHIPLVGITDKTNQKVGSKTEWGYDIISTEAVFSAADLIVASNKEIFEFLLRQKGKIPIFNLNEYCPY